MKASRLNEKMENEGSTWITLRSWNNRKYGGKFFKNAQIVSDEFYSFKNKDSAMLGTSFPLLQLVRCIYLFGLPEIPSLAMATFSHNGSFSSVYIKI